MYYVYLIKSIKHPSKFYAGYTTHLKKRLETHNSGGSVYTAEYRPWDLVIYHAFKDKMRAIQFEKYLKSHSGRAFAQKHLL